jgi:hypothetical protein
MPLEHCFSSLKLEMIRTAELTAAGAPDAPSGMGYTSDAMVGLDFGFDFEAGDDLTVKNGAGDVCATFRDVDQIKNATLGLTLCRFDLELYGMMIGGDLISDGGEVVGFEPPSVDASTQQQLSFEAWTQARDGGSAAVPTVTTPNAALHHFVWPLTKWSPDNMTLDNDFHEIALQGVGEENSQITIDGPFNDWPSYIVTHGGITRVFGVFYDEPVPTAACGAAALAAS